MKRFVLVFLILSLFIIMQFVVAQEFPIDLINNIADDSYPEEYVFEESQSFGIESEFSLTNLFIELEASGNYHDEGNIFSLIAHVTNIGNYPAFLTRVKLKNIPSDWEVYPDSETKYILIIYPDQTKTVKFILRKGASDSTVFATAKAINSEEVSSEFIPIPIFWTTVGLLSITMLGLALYYYRKKC